LLSNAIKYSPEGGPIEIMAQKVRGSSLPAELDLPQSQHFLKVTVSDEGIGIPEAKRELLFRRFTRIHDDRKIEGIGLGLFIAKTLIEKHDGKIWLEPKEKGSRFCLVLPVIEENVPADTILLVDSDLQTLRVLHRSISDLGFDVITASDSKDALDKAFRFRPKMIVLEPNLPVKSGTEFLDQVMTHTDTRTIPVIIFTGKNDLQIPQQFRGIPVLSKHAGVAALKSLIQKKLAV
ncbi:MAG TPA: hybrid sensor histidine kinase/response regulator, partial [Acidobacteriota bacterium]|nr:hybrid sensor histidine kinase/response regulator [Acidobacteriota bacterium]